MKEAFKLDLFPLLEEQNELRELARKTKDQNEKKSWQEKLKSVQKSLKHLNLLCLEGNEIELAKEREELTTEKQLMLGMFQSLSARQRKIKNPAEFEMSLQDWKSMKLKLNKIHAKELQLEQKPLFKVVVKQKEEK